MRWSLWRFGSSDGVSSNSVSFHSTIYVPDLIRDPERQTVISFDALDPGSSPGCFLTVVTWSRLHVQSALADGQCRFLDRLCQRRMRMT